MNDDDWFAELEALQAEGRQLQTDSEELQREIAGLLSIGEHGAVTVVLDAQGLIADISIDEELRAEVEPEELVQEINLAIARAVSVLGSRNQPRWETESDMTAGSMALAPVIGQLLASLSTGIQPVPREFENDLETVTVTALLGSIVTVACAIDWLRAASGATIAEEVVRIARQASMETDVFGRFTKSGVHDG